MSNLSRAIDHIRSAHACCEAIEAGNVQHEDLVTLHAHTMAADSYLNEARRDEDFSLPLPADDHGGGAETATDAALPDQEARSIRQATRATAATVLLASGNPDGAARLLRTPPERR
jgi:hypothetical protein